MIPSISNIKKAIYCLNKRIDLLEGGHYLDTWNNKANIWRGTLAEYDLILTPDDNTIYIIIPDVP